MAVNPNPLTGLPENAVADGWVLIQSVATRTASNGNRYRKWEALDITGTPVTGTLYENKVSGHFPEPQPGEAWGVVGQIGKGRANNYMVFATALLKLNEEQTAEFKAICFPSLPKDEIEFYMQTMRNYIESLVDPELKRLAQALYGYMEPSLPVIPAAKAVHEPIRGGLVKHLTDVVRILDNPVTMCRGLDRDILVFTALFHDMGKIRAYTPDITMTREGKLVPHSFIAVQLITYFMLINSITIDPKKLVHILHCFASHHGPHSEIMPLTREACELHHADELAAKLGHFEEIIKRRELTEDGWGPWDKVLDGYPYIPELDTSNGV